MVQIFPLAFDFDVSFVHPPPPTYITLILAERFIQQRCQAHNPAMKSGMVNDNAVLRQHIFEIAQAEGVSQIPANTLSNNINGIVQGFKSFSYQRHGQVTL